MADHTSPELPRAVRRPNAVIDLRSEPPARHRQTRGVPREPDARLRAYRDRPAHPTTHDAPHRNRPIDVPSVPAGREGAARPDHHDGPGAAGSVEAHATDAAVTGPTDDAPLPTPAPTLTTAPIGDGRKKLLMGRLVVKRLRLRSVAKVTLTFYLCLWAVVAVAGTILWSLANREGWVTGWTGFLVDIGFTDATVDGATLARASATAGAIMVVTATLLTVAAAFFYNQLSGLIGGVEVTFISPKPRRRDRRGRRR